MEKRRDVFMAIADPTRREIINMLTLKSLNLNAIADHFETSRPTISQHVKFLQDCGLLIIKKQGRERYCEANLTSLKAVSDWVQKYNHFWGESLNSLKDFIENTVKK